ncbi:serine hydrolase domain-containing protein [Formosa maritima]|uniref:Beta-lactamase family protein n=1 Tax=Formosa maritima TaxID=2592046 RepID=A0A5D0G3A8_9FLAO|nr:serine hydrolase domain-containing protein [Formosa maritima]TYA53318.1 beta-lactamase family protein [Formosa maritima]
MKQVYLFILIIIGLIYSPSIQGQVIDLNHIESKIDALVPSSVKDNTPGLVVGIVQNGNLIFSKGYGLANLSYKIPNDSKMVYNIGSVSKQFLGYAFAMLQVEGKIKLDDPVNKYLEDWPEFDQPVTIRHLLSHTSGYREAYTMSSLAGRNIGVDRLSQEECLEVVRKQPQLEFEPGSTYTYNSTAWVILAEVFEKAAGMSAAKWVTLNILKPLEMNDTQIETHVGEVIINAAESYSSNQSSGYTNEKSNRAIFGAADVYTSVQDITKWINNYSKTKLGGDAVNKLFLEPFVFNNGINSGYALGIEIGTYRGLKTYSHNGGHEAFITQLMYFPDQYTGIFTVSNFGRNGVISINKIADVLLEEFMIDNDFEYEGIPIKKEALEQLSGLYVVSTLNKTINLTIVEDTLSINSRRKLIPTEPTIFRINGSDDQVLIEKLSNGKIQLTSIRTNSKEVFERVESWSPKAEELVSFKGDYWSSELETVYNIHVVNNQLIVKHRWNEDITLKPISKDFFGTDYGLYIKFNRNEKGEIIALSIYSGRTLNVIFEKK